jgi:hypothetical protein
MLQCDSYKLALTRTLTTPTALIQTKSKLVQEDSMVSTYDILYDLLSPKGEPSQDKQSLDILALIVGFHAPRGQSWFLHFIDIKDMKSIQKGLQTKSNGGPSSTLEPSKLWCRQVHVSTGPASTFSCPF